MFCVFFVSAISFFFSSIHFVYHPDTLKWIYNKLEAEKKIQERKNDQKGVLHQIGRNDLNISLFCRLSVFICARFPSI